MKLFLIEPEHDISSLFDYIVEQDKKLVVEVRSFDRNKEISLAQMAYLHCREGPIQLLSEHHAVSPREAELILKRECSEHLFVHELKGDNWWLMMEKRGKAYFECLNPLCRKLIEPSQVIRLDLARACPRCKTKHPRCVMIISKTELTTKQTNEWIESIYEWMFHELNINIRMPDKEWRLTYE